MGAHPGPSVALVSMARIVIRAESNESAKAMLRRKSKRVVEKDWDDALAKAEVVYDQGNFYVRSLGV